MAIVWSVLQLRPYHEGCGFTLDTDHHSLQRILNQTDESGELARCRLHLFEFGFEAVCKASVGQQTDDALSRLLAHGTYKTPPEVHLSAMYIKIVHSDDNDHPEQILKAFSSTMM